MTSRPSWLDETCGNCGRAFEHGEQRRRRHVPLKTGRRDVCQGCADLIDAQETLDVTAVDRAVEHHHRTKGAA